MGDEIRDIEAAREVGLKTVAVAWGFGMKPALEDAGPDFVFEAVEQFRVYVSILVECKKRPCACAAHFMKQQGQMSWIVSH